MKEMCIRTVVYSISIFIKYITSFLVFKPLSIRQPYAADQLLHIITASYRKNPCILVIAVSRAQLNKQLFVSSMSGRLPLHHKAPSSKISEQIPDSSFEVVIIRHPRDPYLIRYIRILTVFRFESNLALTSEYSTECIHPSPHPYASFPTCISSVGYVSSRTYSAILKINMAMSTYCHTLISHTENDHDSIAPKLTFFLCWVLVPGVCRSYVVPTHALVIPAVDWSLEFVMLDPYAAVISMTRIGTHILPCMCIDGYIWNGCLWAWCMCTWLIRAVYVYVYVLCNQSGR